MIRILNLVIEVEESSEADEVLTEFKKALNELLLKFWEIGQAEINVSDTGESANLARPSRVYWFAESKKEKDILIFDAGYERGRIYIYELKDTKYGKELKKELKKHGSEKSWRIVPDS